MGHIGVVIEKYRQALDMSRRELAENICSEKYIYLIEKGERTPSVELLKQLGDRLGVHLFDYHHYVDTQDPFRVRKLMRTFYMCRINLNLNLLDELTQEAKDIPDFKKQPWSFEISLNNIYHKALIEKNYGQSLVDLNNLQNEVKKTTAPCSVFLTNLYSLMCSCSLLVYNKNDALNFAESAYKLVKENPHIELYEPMLTKATVNLMGAYYVNDKFDRVIEIGEELLKIKQYRDSYGKIYFVQLFMSLAYYTLGNWGEALIYLKKAALFLLSDSKQFDIGFLALDDCFIRMLDDLSPQTSIIDYFRKEYRI